ncbi:hypothetical protein [Streptomyces yanii]|uniref:Uncharacterized protein n=1 Tax=Streptomyces yanii TaxID=78510 RepID=A0ABV5R244_9ACTN
MAEHPPTGTPQSNASAGPAPTPGTPPSPAPTPTPESPSVVDQLVELAAPDSAEPGRGRKWGLKKIGFSIVAFMVVTVVGCLIAFSFDWWTSEDRAVKDDKNQDKIEDAKPAFGWRLDPALGDDEPWESWEIDRTLTSAEQRRLASLDGEDKAAVWAFVKELNGRKVRGIAAIYNLQLTSEKQKSVLITKLSAKTTRCWPSRARTTLSIGTGGSESWDEVHFNLVASGAPAPPLGYTEVEPGQVPEEIPYKKAISLGNTQSPGLLAITPYVMERRDCEWQMDLEFNVNSGQVQTRKITHDSAGKKLMVYGLGREGVDSWSWTGNAPAGSGWMKSETQEQ